MADIADRYRKVAGSFTKRVNGVSDSAWDNQSPCTDETLDPDEAQRLFEMLQKNADQLRGNGAFGPEVPAPDDADIQTKMLAFTGRHP